MTRADMAEALEQANPSPLSWEEAVALGNVMAAAAAELRKSCALCQHWVINENWTEGAGCKFPRNMPADGTGHCHSYAPKEPA